MSDKPFEAPAEAVATRFQPGNSAIVILRGLAGGIVGGAIGFFVFQWLAKEGMYGMMIPGAATGLGAGLAAGRRSMALGVLCALAAIGLSIFAEWAAHPFLQDKSFAFFVAHLHELRSMTWIMIGLGVAFAYWLGQGR
jgi:hypothetical protein